MQLKVPTVGESVSEVEIGEWLKQEGDSVTRDEAIATLESDKATLDLPAPADGTLKKILKKAGESAEVGEVIGEIDTRGGGPKASRDSDGKGGKAKDSSGSAKSGTQKTDGRDKSDDQPVMPAAQRLIDKNELEAGEIEGTGKGGRILKADVLRFLDRQDGDESGGESGGGEDQGGGEGKAGEKPPAADSGDSEPRESKGGDMVSGDRQEEVVRMSPLRRTIARRLVEAQQSMAMLTTFNEIDMASVMGLRAEFKAQFQEKHGIKLGFMSFFVKAVIEGLKQCPALNGEIREDSIAYRNYYDIGIAIGGGKGLVVPVIRNAERLSFAEIEAAIADLAKRANENKIKPDELSGGTFTITNGGVYGSLLSTPIVNPPQSGVLGVHAINDRPIAVDGQVVIRPMMYVALSYDHRIVDGREAVTFLSLIKELLETPARMLLEI